MNIIDVRKQLPTAGWAHPALTDMQVVVLHYAAGATEIGKTYSYEQGFLNILKSYAKLHMNRIGNDGIAYTYAVDKFGKVYRCRDNRVSWHCANVVGNNHGIGVICPLGDTEKPTEAMLQGLRELFLDIKRQYPSVVFKGHKDMSNTACPGSALYDWLQSFNRGDTPMPENKPQIKKIKGIAVVFQAPSLKSAPVLSLPNDHIEGFDKVVVGDSVLGSTRWYHCSSGAGFIPECMVSV
jgi:hypothetical protein